MSLLGDTQSPLSLHGLRRQWNWFFYESADPALTSVVRIGYATLLLLMLVAQWPEVTLFLTNDGLLPFEASRHVVDPDTRTVLALFENTTGAVHLCYSILVLQTVMLLLGLAPRFQAICILMWLTSFNHRNSMILNGEDTVFRLFALLLSLTPCGCRWSLDNLVHKRKHGKDRVVPTSAAWGLRLMQIQLSVIYASTAWEKLNGNAWLDGTALYYASRLDDLFGRFPVPSILFDNLTALQWMTWTALAVEVLLPILLWFKETRRWAVLMGIWLHLSIEWMMNLNFFEWIMIVGLMSFTKSTDLEWLKGLFSKRSGTNRHFQVIPKQTRPVAKGKASESPQPATTDSTYVDSV